MTVAHDRVTIGRDSAHVSASAWAALAVCAILVEGTAQAQDSPAPPKPRVSTEMLRLADLVGEWNVEFESRNSADEPFTSLRTTSLIEPLLGGAFVQERLTLPTPRGRSIELVGIWGFDRFRSMYRFAWLDDMYKLFDVHEGNWSDEVLVVDNTRARTTLLFEGTGYFSRMRWRPISRDGFNVESLVSTDAGATWTTLQRGRYTPRL